MSRRDAPAAHGAVAGVRSTLRGSRVTHAIGVLGDRWSLLIIRDAFQGARRFEEFLERGGASRATLARRLRALVDQRILDRVSGGGATGRPEYRLSRRGRDLYPLSLVAWNWERRWAPAGAGIPARLRHLGCGREMRPVVACAHCGQLLSLGDLRLETRVAARGRRPGGPPRLRRRSSTTAATHRGSQASLTHIADIVGDPWTPLVIAAALLGLRRFDELRLALGIASNILAGRLALLVEEGILERRPYQDQPPRHEYRLTDKGRDLFAYALVLDDWGGRWLGAAGSPMRLRHRACGRIARPVVGCNRCGAPLTPGDVAAHGRAAGMRKVHSSRRQHR